MSKKKEKWYRVRVLLKNGHTFKTKVKSTQDNLDHIFGMVHDVWKDKDAGGYLNLSGTHLSMREIVMFKVKKMFCRFF